MSKLDYLQKYMSSGNEKKSDRSYKKRSKKHKNTKNLKIIDTELKFIDRRERNGGSSCDEFDLEEEKPQVYIEGNKLLSEYNSKDKLDQKQKWAPVSWGALEGESHSVRPEADHEFKDDGLVGGVSVERRRYDSPDLSPTRPRRTRDTPDLSPKRRRPRSRSGSTDLSPRRSRKRDRHDSPETFRDRHDSPDKDDDGEVAFSSSPESNSKARARYQRQSSSPDLSPVRREDNVYLKSEKKGQSRQTSSMRREVSPEVVTREKKAGLQSANSLREENIQRKVQEEKYFTTMEKSMSGKGATTIYRRKSGKKIDLEEEKKRKDEEEKLKAKEQVKYDAWKKGLRQQEDYSHKLNEDLYEMSKPLARYQDDKDLDDILKKQERDEDPMLAFIRKTKTKAKEKKKERPRYKGPNPPPNRFNLWPGYRWDGVDRSNGFEKKRFAAISERQSMSNEAYKWSVEDM